MLDGDAAPWRVITCREDTSAPEFRYLFTVFLKEYGVLWLVDRESQVLSERGAGPLILCGKDRPLFLGKQRPFINTGIYTCHFGRRESLRQQVFDMLAANVDHFVLLNELVELKRRFQLILHSICAWTLLRYRCSILSAVELRSFHRALCNLTSLLKMKCCFVFQLLCFFRN